MRYFWWCAIHSDWKRAAASGSSLPSSVRTGPKPSEKACQVDAASGTHRIQWTAVDDARAPADPDAVRIHQAGGYWEFAPQADGNTRVVYETYIDLGG